MRGAFYLLLRQAHRHQHICAAPHHHLHQLFPPFRRTPPRGIRSAFPTSRHSNVRFSSSGGGGDGETSSPPADAPGPPASSSDSKEITKASAADLVEGVSNAELKQRIERYFKGDEEALPSIMEAILRRKMSGKHEETDDELMEELRMQPLQDVKDREFEEDFDELYSTDEEIPDLYNARNHVEQKMAKDEYFNMDERKWDEMVQEAVEKGFVKGTAECERILEDMLKWDSLLPDYQRLWIHIPSTAGVGDHLGMPEWDMIQSKISAIYDTSEEKLNGRCEAVHITEISLNDFGTDRYYVLSHQKYNISQDEIKQKVEVKFHELGDLCERGELQPEEAYELFKEFEDKIVLECAEMMEAKECPDGQTVVERGKKEEPDDPSSEGPILRWETRAVFAPGGDAWHPKNRKVKLSVTVRELGLSRHAFRRLREVVGKRYHPGRDELVLICERFEHREENRKDCLRTLYALIDDARKADKLVVETRNAYVKDRLKGNPQFMERLHTKVAKMHVSPSAAPL